MSNRDGSVGLEKLSNPEFAEQFGGSEFLSVSQGKTPEHLTGNGGFVVRTSRR